MSQCSGMFRGRKSRKNILGLLEALQLQHKSEDTDKVTEEKPRTKKKKRKGTRTESVSPRGREVSY